MRIVRQACDPELGKTSWSGGTLWPCGPCTPDRSATGPTLQPSRPSGVAIKTDRRIAYLEMSFWLQDITTRWAGALADRRLPAYDPTPLSGKADTYAGRCARIVATACTGRKRTYATREASSRGRSHDQLEAREGPAGHFGVAERSEVVLKPGKAEDGRDLSSRQTQDAVKNPGIGQPIAIRQQSGGRRQLSS
jgi:hypothetical protein